jgi:hypothetical protein
VLATPRTKRFCFGPGSSQSWFYPARGVTPSGLDSIHQTLKPRERSTLFALLGTARQGGTWTTEKRRKSFHADPGSGTGSWCHERLSTNHLHSVSARNVAPACTPLQVRLCPANHATSSINQHHPRDQGPPWQNVITRRKSGKCPAGACQFNASNGSLLRRMQVLRRQPASGRRPCPPLARGTRLVQPISPLPLELSSRIQ